MPDFFGGGSGAPMEAANAQAMYAGKAAELQQAFLQKSLKDVEPWLKQGQWGVGQIGDILSGRANINELLRRTPGYDFTQREGIKGLDLSAASRGLSKSGPQMKGVTNWSEELALNKAYLPFMSELQNLSGAGLNAGQMGGNWTTQVGGQIGQDLLMAGQAMGQGIYNDYLSNQSSGLGSILGAGLGFLSSGAGGLSGLFGGDWSGGLGKMFSGGGGMSNFDMGGTDFSKSMPGLDFGGMFGGGGGMGGLGSIMSMLPMLAAVA